MGGRPRIEKQQRNRSLIQGTKKHFGAVPTLDLRGRKFTPPQVVQLLESQIELLSEIVALEAARHDAIQRERAVEKQLGPMLQGLHDLADNTFGKKEAPLADFGWRPRGKPGPKTPKVKVEAASKARATRAARHTMGKRQKRKIKAGG